MMRNILVFLILLNSTYSFGGNVSVLNYGVTNGSTTAYITAVASTPINTYLMYICDTSGDIVKIASGLTTAATDLFTAPVSGCAFYNLTTPIPAGTQLDLGVVNGSNNSTAKTGYNSMSFFQ
jgi:hypothetical protein